MSRHWVILREVDVGAIKAAGTSLVEVANIREACKDHISCTVYDAVIGVRCNTTEELVDSISGGLGDLDGHDLFGADSTESNKKFISDCASVPQEGANNTLDAFDAGQIKWSERIVRSRLLGIGAVGDEGILVWGQLGLRGSRVTVASEDFLDVAWHRDATRAF